LNRIMLFLHLLGAVGMGFYLLLPFFLRKTWLQNRGVLQVYYWMNFTVQWILVAQFVTGLIMYLQGNYPVLWIILVAVVFTGVGAFGGMFGYHCRKAPPSFEEDRTGWLKKVRFHAILTSICMYLILVLMKFPYGW
jgi:hypothetical protein